MKKIITHYEPKPVPIRVWDWEAYREDWDEGDHIGHGATEEEAIENLKELEELDQA